MVCDTGKLLHKILYYYYVHYQLVMLMIQNQHILHMGLLIDVTYLFGLIFIILYANKQSKFSILQYGCCRLDYTLINQYVYHI